MWLYILLCIWSSLPHLRLSFPQPSSSLDSWSSCCFSDEPSLVFGSTIGSHLVASRKTSLVFCVLQTCHSFSRTFFTSSVTETYHVSNKKPLVSRRFENLNGFLMNGECYYCNSYIAFHHLSNLFHVILFASRISWSSNVVLWTKVPYFFSWTLIENDIRLPLMHVLSKERIVNEWPFHGNTCMTATKLSCFSDNCIKVRRDWRNSTNITSKQHWQQEPGIGTTKAQKLLSILETEELLDLFLSFDHSPETTKRTANRHAREKDNKTISQMETKKKNKCLRETGKNQGYSLQAESI